MSIGVSNWDEEYSNHAVWKLIDATIDAIDRVEIDDENVADDLAHLRAALLIVLEWQDAPSLLVSPHMLSNLDAALRSPVKGQLDNWHNNRNVAHLTNAYNGLSGVLEVTRGWPPTKDRYAKGLINTIQEVEREAEVSLDSLKEAVNAAKTDLRTQLDAVNANIDSREATANERLQTLTDEVVQAQQTLTQLLAKANEIDTRVSTVANSQQTAFTDAENKRQIAHSEAIEEQKDDFEKAIDEAVAVSKTKLESQEMTGEEVLKRLRELETQAKNLVEATSEASTTTDYGKYAETEKRTADRLRVAAALLLVLGGLTVVGVLVYEGFQGSMGQTWLVKSALSLPFVAAAWYLIRESSRHRDEAELAKDTQLKILALSPFITNMTDDDQRELRKAAATELFVKDRRLSRLKDGKDK